MQKLILLTGPTGVGKSTFLQQHLPKGSKGILSLLKEEKRFFCSLSSESCWPMEAASAEQDQLQVGRYRFSSNAFRRAVEVLQREVKTADKTWLVVDEVGPLELRGEGLAGVLPTLLQYPGPLLWVVRESALEAVQRQWYLSQIRDVQIIHWQQVQKLLQLLNRHSED